MATVKFSETLESHQYSMRPSPESQSYTVRASVRILLYSWMQYTRDGKPFPISVPIEVWFIILDSLVYHLLFSFKNRHKTPPLTSNFQIIFYNMLFSY
jgi:hypothetical protein